MSTSSPKPVTQLLEAVSAGQASAQDKLWSAVYEELRGMAHKQMGHESPGHTMQSTALVHEAYLRLVGDEEVQWVNRRHFFAAAARAMRRIRIDEARRRGRVKRGGGRQRVAIDEAAVAFDQDPAELLAIDEALDELEKSDKRKAEIVLLRYFAGLTIDETAAALEVSARTVDNEWRFARAWLHRQLKSGDTTSAKEGAGDGG